MMGWSLAAVLAAVAPLSVIATGATNLIEPRGEDSQIIQVESYVKAGLETTWELHLGNRNFSRDGARYLSIVLAASPGEEQEGGYYIGYNYCVLSPCIHLNVTSVALAIPEDAFPTDSLFAHVSLWDELGRYQSLAVGNDTVVTVYDAEGNYSPYERSWGWPVMSSRIPCEKVACARGCLIDNYAAETSQETREQRINYERCLDTKCDWTRGENLLSMDPDAGCITTNSRAPPPPPEPEQSQFDGGTGGLEIPRRWLSVCVMAAFACSVLLP
ncbi:hypothetical protein B0I35DRAFT_437661 [Stachybotrys elegans]|uniref:Uncharacterized protein n=1 Tax=Stachybotrys elegans TaxID=80388 RepID=A0A8K0SNU7_9HYPO|nr:hypothetical protein B0I35DRAFT_437661 [Stachybotrys elegans]